MPETRAPSLVREDPTRLGATKPHSRRACALSPRRRPPRPSSPQPALRKRRGHRREEPASATGGERAQPWRPSGDESHKQAQSVFKKQTATARFVSGLGDQEQASSGRKPSTRGGAARRRDKRLRGAGAQPASDTNHCACAQCQNAGVCSAHLSEA